MCFLLFVFWGGGGGIVCCHLGCQSLAWKPEPFISYWFYPHLGHCFTQNKAIQHRRTIKEIFDDFEVHFKMKLLSAADGSFDGIYNARFSGIQKKKFVYFTQTLLTQVDQLDIHFVKDVYSFQ